MFTNFSIGGLTIANLQAQVLGFLGNPFVVAAIVAVLALVFVPQIVRTFFSIAGVNRALRAARWHVTNQPGRLYAQGEDPGDVEFWYDQDVTKGRSRPVFFRRNANYRLQKHRRKSA